MCHKQRGLRTAMPTTVGAAERVGRSGERSTGHVETGSAIKQVSCANYLDVIMIGRAMHKSSQVIIVYSVYLSCGLNVAYIRSVVTA